ncbi:MAG: hypothetical protein AB1710_07705 [Pseudomonadota bacterium]
MTDTRSQIIMASFAWVPYVLVSWGYARLSDGSFWSALGVLLAIRLFFSVIETLGSVFAWRLYGRRKMIERNLAMLRANNFPKRQYAHDDFLNYLSRIEDDETCPQQLKMAAKQWEQALAFFESSGILLGMRMHAAADAALDIYSPKHEAPIVGTKAA